MPLGALTYYASRQPQLWLQPFLTTWKYRYFLNFWCIAPKIRDYVCGTGRTSLGTYSSVSVWCFGPAFSDSAGTSIAEFYFDLTLLWSRLGICSYFMWRWGKINNRNRYRVIVAHEILLLFDPSYQIVIGKATKLLRWFLTNAGCVNADVYIDNSTGTIPTWYFNILCSSHCSLLYDTDEGELLNCSESKMTKYSAPPGFETARNGIGPGTRKSVYLKVRTNHA